MGGRYRLSLDGAPPYRYANVPSKAMFRPGEVAAIFDVSLTTVYRLVRAGKVTAHRLERQIRIPRAAVLAYLDHVDDLGVEDGD